MRKALIVMALLFALGAGGTAAVFARVNEQRDQVVLTERILFGDVSRAEGLSVTAKSHMDGHLHWATTRIIGAQPETKTDFRFTAGEEREYNFDYEPEGLRVLNLHDRAHRSGEWREGENGEGLIGLDLAYWELFQQAQPGEENKETIIHIRDYYDYYPIEVSVQLFNYEFNSGSDAYYLAHNDAMENEMRRLTQALQDYLKIPVLQTETVYISVDKREDGQMGGYGFGSGDGDHFWMQTYNALTEDGCYFILSNRSADGVIMDFDRIPGGYGIHKIPYELNSDHNVERVDVEGISMVYPLAEDSQILWFTPEADRDRLLLLTLEEERDYVLRVIDCADMSTVQEILLASGEERGIHSYVCRDGYLVLRRADNGLVVLEERDGLYETVIDIPLTEEEQITYGVGVTLWDGEKLAMAVGNQYEDRQNGDMCCFSAAVYDSTGAIFGAKYTGSLDTKNYDYYHSLSCRLVEKDPISLEWRK